MATCSVRPDLSTSYCYKHWKCRCSSCKDWKRIAEFPRRDKAREASRLWRLNNLERSRQNSKDYQQKNPEKVLGWNLKKYKLTTNDYKLLEEKQGYVCAICKQTCKYHGRLSVDHSHKTGKVRGLLCGNCNTAIGKLQENPMLFDAAKEYLLKENGDVYT